MSSIDYSIIIFNNDSNNLINCLEKIAEQTYKNYEVIIETEKLTKKCQEEIAKLAINYQIREMENLNLADAYNDGLKISSGNYITFINSSIMYNDAKTLEKVNKYIVTYGTVVCNIKYYDNDTKLLTKYKMSSTLVELLNVEKSAGYVNLCLESYFINKNLLKKILFNNKFNDEAKEKFIIDLYQVQPKYYNLGNVSLISYASFQDNQTKYELAHDINWYNPSLLNWLSFLKEQKNIPLYIQEIIMYIIYVKYNANLADFNKGVLNKEELDKFIQNTTKLLGYIDNTIILQTKVDGEYKQISHRFNMPRALKMYFYKLKNKENDSVFVSNGMIFETFDNLKTPVLNLSNEKVTVYAINYQNDKLTFDCAVNLLDYLKEDEFKIKVFYGNDNIAIKKLNIYNISKVFGNVYNEKYFFQFTIDIKNNYNDLKVYVAYNNKNYLLTFNYAKVQSRLSTSKRAYWNVAGYTLENNQDKIVISKRCGFKTFKLECLFALSKLKNESNKIRVCKLLFLRFLYYLTKPFLQNKHIWLTFDKLYKSGDNGEYIYQYGLKHNKNIYYIIRKSATEYKRLVKENKKHVLVFNSLKAKLYALHAEAILKTHANILGFCGFDGLARIMVRGLFNAEIIEIQHGLTIQDIPEYQHRLVDNNKLYLIASNKEYNNIIKPTYDYSDEQIKLVGLARYDGLTNRDQKFILITPTWRHNLASPSVKHGVLRSHNDIFKQSDYFKIYNSLINNEKLIKTAKDYGYRIVYLLHPTLATQINDFDRNDYVDIIPGNISYEKILTEASLMVTDYSGVQFDFAYMRKPIIYFHPDKLPPHYDNSIDYENDGFGPIIKQSEKLVDLLCEKMKNECKNEDMYIDRANNFFAYDDLNNCKRIMDAVDEFLGGMKNGRENK